MKKFLCTLILISIPILLILTTYTLSQNVQEEPLEYSDNTAQYIQAHPKDIISFLEKGVPGTYYFGFPSCDWCRELLPVLNSVLKNKGLQAYTLNTDSNKFESQEKEKLEKFFIANTKKNELTVPFIVHITSKGTIKTHVGTVDSHNAKLHRMSSSQIQLLTTELSEMISE